jgi:hypothetical protein
MLHPLATEAGQEEKLIPADPLLKVTIGFIYGDRRHSPSPHLRPPELKKKETQLYLGTDPAEWIRRPPPTYRHHARPRQVAGKSLKTTP